MAQSAPKANYVELASASQISNADSAEQFNRALIPFLLEA
jgi:hypothetical protein